MQQVPLCRWALFPLAAYLAQPVGAKLEFAAQTPQHFCLFAVGVVFKSAGNVIRALALSAVIDKAILGQNRTQPFESLGIDARPEQREIADVAMIFASGAAAGRQGLGLEQHVYNIF